MINAPHDKEFIFHDGTKARNLLDLVSKLESMQDHSFHHFVNAHKNDFANWVEHVFSDKRFSEKLRTTTSRLETIQLLKDRINEISLGVPVGGSLVKTPKSESHASVHHEMHETHEIHEPHEMHESREKHEIHHKEDVRAFPVKEKHSDSTEKTERTEREERPDTDKEKRSGHHWLKMFSKKDKKEIKDTSDKKNITEKKDTKETKSVISPELKKIEKEAETPHVTNIEIDEQLAKEQRENALWVTLYFALVLLIITLLMYKLFL